MKRFPGRRFLWSGLLLNLLLVHGIGWAAGEIDQAKKFISQYMGLEKRFSPEIVNLYDDSANIQNIRLYPDGNKKVIHLNASTYKQLMAATLKLARQKGDTNNYSNIRYDAEGAQVRVSATRHSNLKNYDSPISWLVGPDAHGKWVIFEELSESQP